MRWKERLAAVVALGALFAPRGGHAESALTTLAGSIVKEVGPLPHRVFVVASPLASDSPAPRGDELASRIAALVAASVGPSASADEHPEALTAARSRRRDRSGKLDAVLYLDIKVTTGELRVTADVYPVVANGWDHVRLGLPTATGHAYVHSPIGAEVRSYLPPIRLEHATVEKFAHDAGQVLAVACGDIDGDGANDLALVSDREVMWGFLRGGHFVAVRRAAAASLGRRAPVPWREPLATASVTPGTLRVGWSDRKAVSVGADLVTSAPLAGLPLPGATSACALPNAARGAFERIVACAQGETEPVVSRSPRLPALFDAAAFLDLPSASGPSMFALVRAPGGALHVFRPDGDPIEIDDVGAQLALGDLDEDGAPEIVTTRDHGDDVLSVVSLRGGADGSAHLVACAEGGRCRRDLSCGGERSAFRGGGGWLGDLACPLKGSPVASRSPLSQVSRPRRSPPLCQGPRSARVRRGARAPRAMEPRIDGSASHRRCRSALLLERGLRLSLRHGRFGGNRPSARGGAPLKRHHKAFESCFARGSASRPAHLSPRTTWCAPSRAPARSARVGGWTLSAG